MIRGLTYDPDKVDAVMDLWNCGFDTARISITLGVKESEVERILHFALDQRRKQRENK